METSKILKDLRLEANLTQKELANKLKIGQSTIVGYEKGEREATLTNLSRYAEFFEVSLDYLAGLEDDFGARTAPAPAAMGESVSTKERELLQLFRGLSPYLQDLTLNTVRGWAGGSSNAGGKGLQKKA